MRLKRQQIKIHQKIKLKILIILKEKAYKKTK